MGQDAGVDRAGDRFPSRHPGDHGAAEHVGDLPRADRPARLLHHDEPGRPAERRMTHRPAQGEVAAAHHHERHVGHLEQRPGRRRLGGAGIDERGHRTVAERHRERGTRLGFRTGRQRRGWVAGRDQRDAGRRLDREPIQRVARRPGPGLEPVGDAGAGFGAEAEDRRLVTAEIDEPGTRAAGENERSRRRRTRTCRSHPWGTRA